VVEGSAVQRGREEGHVTREFEEVERVDTGRSSIEEGNHETGPHRFGEYVGVVNLVLGSVAPTPNDEE